MKVIDLYERHARAYDADRSRSLQERAWLDRFLGHVPAGGTVVDLGCGSGEPIARYLIDRGIGVVGVDASPSMIDMCRARFPDSEWLVVDMRELELERRFEGILAWDSFFHLGVDDQRDMFPRFARHARHGAPLMFTSGPAEGGDRFLLRRIALPRQPWYRRVPAPLEGERFRIERAGYAGRGMRRPHGVASDLRGVARGNRPPYRRGIPVGRALKNSAEGCRNTSLPGPPWRRLQLISPSLDRGCFRDWKSDARSAVSRCCER